tara:strand:- start:287 stop:460 length:174 start_codon:yes stop_codon:yes gene_type:complete
MPNLLDHVPAVPLLESLDHWPATATRQHYFELTRELVARTAVKDCHCCVASQNFIGK